MFCVGSAFCFAPARSPFRESDEVHSVRERTQHGKTLISIDCEQRQESRES